MRVLLLSTYELGHQPLGLARPAADLLAAGHEVRCQDLAIERLDEHLVAWAGLVGISVPMHTATRLGVRVAAWVRELNPAAHVAFYGLYASLHTDVLVGRLGDSAIGGEYEGPLVALADALDRRNGRADPLGAVAGVRTASDDGGIFLGRQSFRVPRRDLLPPLDRYAHVDLGTHQKVAGYVEASRGCAHRCLHCPITPVYGGRLRVVERDVVLDDIEQLVRLGAEHITFGDPDFFNGIRHSLRIVEELHAAFPRLTYDVTIKVEHLLEHREHLPTLARTGCLFIVSAVEAVHDDVLAHLAKGHTAADVDTALALTRDVGIPIRPTFVPFTPWLSLDGYVGLLRFVRARGLLHHVDPVQFAIRLLVPRGSSLYGTPSLAPYVGEFDSQTFSYAWIHPDPRMDALQRDVAAAVEAAAASGESPEQTLRTVEQLALKAAGGGSAGISADDDPFNLVEAAFVPRLTETWFC
jgi:radical SAM superfamily enzyme YgiQ (UPF0313 family)